jgi:hypothetical protein
MSGPVALLDYDRDGWPDVVTSLFFPGPNIVLLRNLAGQAFAAPQTVAGPILRGYSNYGINDLIDLASGDFDGDSWPDLVVTASGEHPLVWRNNGSGLSPYAGACGAAGFPTPRTTGSGLLQLGSSTFALELQGATPNAPGALWIGLSKRFAFGLPLLPFDLAALGAPGCAVVASAEAPFFVVADAQGRAAVPLAIPNDPALRRFTVFAQCAAAAPGSNAMGWLFGNGLAAKIP